MAARPRSPTARVAARSSPCACPTCDGSHAAHTVLPGTRAQTRTRNPDRGPAQDSSGGHHERSPRARCRGECHCDRHRRSRGAGRRGDESLGRRDWLPPPRGSVEVLDDHRQPVVPAQSRDDACLRRDDRRQADAHGGHGDDSDATDRRCRHRRRRGSGLHVRPARGEHDRLLRPGHARHRVVLRRGHRDARCAGEGHEPRRDVACGSWRRATRDRHGGDAAVSAATFARSTSKVTPRTGTASRPRRHRSPSRSGRSPKRCATAEWTPLEPSVRERKTYARGVGELSSTATRGPAETESLVEVRHA